MQFIPLPHLQTWANIVINGLLRKLMMCSAKFGELTGRNYQSYEYYGHQNPDRIIIIMGSGAGAIGDPLYMDAVNMIAGEWQGEKLKITAGRYGLASKEFTPAMVKSIFDELKKDQPRKHFTIGIDDDVTHTSLNYDKSFL